MRRRHGTALTSGADNGYRLAPGARIIVSRSGQYEITATLTAPTAVTPSAVEAVARLWAYRATLRPGDLTDAGGEQQVLAGGMMKSWGRRDSARRPVAGSAVIDLLECWEAARANPTPLRRLSRVRANGGACPGGPGASDRKAQAVISLREHGLLERAEVQVTGDYTEPAPFRDVQRSHGRGRHRRVRCGRGGCPAR